jgi:glycosyltransferase involved in cell wall biosynthesis
LKIIHVTARYFPNVGGVETLVKELCESLSSKGSPVIVYCLDLNSNVAKTETINGVLVKRYRNLVGDPLFLPPLSFLRDLQKEKPGIIHVHNLQNIFPLFVSVFKKPDQLLVLQPHYHRYGQTLSRNLLLTLYKMIIPKLILDRSEVIIANSNYEREIIQEDFPKRKNVAVVQEGLAFNELSEVNWCPETPKRILYIGALKKYKKVDVLLRAFKILLNQEKIYKKLVIVGEGPDKSRLMNLTNKLELNEYVEWKTNLTRCQLLAEYSKTSVFVLLSKLESFSRVVNEAIAIGIPTVVLDNDVFSDHANKGLVEVASSDQPEIVAKTILRAQNKASHIKCRKNFQINDSERYSDSIAKIYLKLNKLDI